MVANLFSRLQQDLSRLIGDRLGILHQMRGFRVVVDNTRSDIATADVVQRLDESLALIEQYQPWRLAHLRRDLDHIRVVRYACRGAYFPDQRACMVELTFLARRDIGAATVASTIVHEGMHARTAALGSRLSALSDRTEGREPRTGSRSREERICRRAELEFGESLPADIGAPVVQRALESLALDDSDVAPAIDWNLAQRRIADVDRGSRG
jgi:hypothetical protein